MTPPEDNAATYFIDRHLAEGRAHKITFIDASGAHSYESVALMVNRAGNLLRAIGVARHDRVMIVLEDGIEFVALFFGALKIGAVPIPINTLLAADDYRYLLSDAAPRAIAIAASISERVAAAVGDRIEPARVLLAGGADPHFLALGPALARVPERLEPVPVTTDEVGFWLYSSGSTAGPKGVLHRHGDLLETARLYGERVLGIRSRDVVFSASKMFFAYGLGNTCSFPLHAGATAILSPERLTPAAVLALLRRHQVTAFFGFPSLYAALLSTLEETPAERLEHLRLCVSAGEALPVAIAQRWTGGDARFSTGSVRPRPCTSSSRTARASRGRALPANRSKVTRSRCATTAGVRPGLIKSAISGAAGHRSRLVTGTIPQPHGRRSSTDGSAPATSIFATSTASITTADAPMT
jgi:4-hydroxybenzoate-CoA ligase/benzoate-CoA ligase